MLLRHGNAIDAAIAVAAALSVTEPCSTGLGGDAFALVYTARDAKITAVHGNGAAPELLSAAMCKTRPDVRSPHTITVPGAVALWCDMLDRWGSMARDEVLKGAIDLAEDGFPVGKVTARLWRQGEDVLKTGRGGRELLMADGRGGWRAPREGEMWKNKGVARVLRGIAREGKDGFYKGAVAGGMVAVVRALGGVLTMRDLEKHDTVFADAVGIGYRGYDMWEVGMPAQGVVALMALGVVEGWDMGGIEDEERYHLMVEGVRMGFGEGVRVIREGGGCDEVLSKGFVEGLRGKVGDRKAEVRWGGWMGGGGTVQFCVVDKDGNAVSMVQSNYMGFGTGHVPRGMGFSLHNRGLNFVFGDKKHPNAVKGGKKPYHTIIPGMITKGGKLFAVLGVMGSYMQPQGHVQVIHGLVDRGLNAQEALDRPRFRVTGPFSSGEGLGEEEVLVEEEFDEELAESLRRRGHVVKVGDRELFGRGQVIVVREDGVVEAGSDVRADGSAAVM